ncbi:hypothetical protein [Burkholderia gladioli]|uniref:hypothetical protein n=1 Tax=Burkholderia gladioli TaxID=28095 RepID=UPI0013649C17|nr:hypothetical protein [Burkholderia gladioli]KAF1065547.1 hypothetical protein LvStA_00039 [Burkholderia gladioli]
MNKPSLGVPSRADRRAVAFGIKAAISPIFPVKLTHVEEAVAAGHGFKTNAAMAAAEAAGATFFPKNFSALAFVDRLAALSGDREMAEVAAMTFEGLTLDIAIERYSPLRQRHDRYTDVAYQVRVRVNGLSPAARAETPVFVLPHRFGGSVGRGGIRLASNHEHRVEGKFPVSVGQNGTVLLTAKLMDGGWDGAMYVDLRPDAPDDTRAIGSAKAALARAIAPVVDPWVRCWIFRPDGYGPGTWRMHLSLGTAGRAALGGSTLVFDIPKHPQRRFHVDQGCLFDLIPGERAFKCAFTGDVWSSDLHTTGASEADDVVLAAELRATLLRTINAALGRK